MPSATGAVTALPRPPLARLRVPVSVGVVVGLVKDRPVVPPLTLVTVPNDPLPTRGTGPHCEVASCTCAAHNPVRHRSQELPHHLAADQPTLLHPHQHRRYRGVVHLYCVVYCAGAVRTAEHIDVRTGGEISLLLLP